MANWHIAKLPTNMILYISLTYWGVILNSKEIRMMR